MERLRPKLVLAVWTVSASLLNSVLSSLYMIHHNFHWTTNNIFSSSDPYAMPGQQPVYPGYEQDPYRQDMMMQQQRAAMAAQQQGMRGGIAPGMAAANPWAIRRSINILTQAIQYTGRISHLYFLDTACHLSSGHGQSSYAESSLKNTTG